MTNRFIQPCSSLKKHTRFQSKMAKDYARFQTEMALCGLHKEVALQVILLQFCQLPWIIRETPDFGPYLPVSTLESEISWIITKVCHFL